MIVIKCTEFISTCVPVN